jgi:hypothetical protein
MIKSFLLLFLLIVSVSAYTITYDVSNSQTLLPITGANVTLFNDTVILSNLTGTNGISDLSSNTNSIFYVLVYKGGYDNYISNLNAYNDSYHKILLNPSAAEGIIKLRVEDLTLKSHSFCLYWIDNNRLYKCFSVNDTYITIMNNVNYSLVPDINKLDLITSPTHLKDNLYLIMPMLIGLFVIILIFFMFAGMAVYIYYKIRGKK